MDSPHSIVTVDARHSPFTFDPSRTAVIVVDMQNDFASDGGAFVRAGLDVTPIRRAVPPTARVLDAVRQAGIQVVYLKMEFRPDLSDVGAPDAKNWTAHHLVGIGDPVFGPGGQASRVFIRDTWNTDIVAELAPEPSDIVVSKHRFSGFYATDLHAILRGRGIKYLIFTGCTTSVCVESTLRDAMFRDYCCLLLADCTGEPIGEGLPRSNHEASLLVTQVAFGWVSESEALLQALTASSDGRLSSATSNAVGASANVSA
jgi:ureidoacrylate peracid hydrolase